MNKRLLGIIASLIIMTVIFVKIDREAFVVYARSVDIFLFLIALLLFIPQILISALRWKYMTQGSADISFKESVRLILAASSLNVFLPSKLGDLCKAYFLHTKGHMEMKRGTNIVIFERFIDVMALAFLAGNGALALGLNQPIHGIVLLLNGALMLMFILLLSGKYLMFFNFMPFQHKAVDKLKSFFEDTHAYIQLYGKEGQLSVLHLIFVSILLWALHIAQFYVVFLSIHATASLADVFCLVPMAIFVGLIPVTLAGIGTRDAALLYFFSGIVSAPQIVVVGLFASVRYFVPGLLGMPFMNQYMSHEKSSE